MLLACIWLTSFCATARACLAACERTRALQLAGSVRGLQSNRTLQRGLGTTLHRR